MQDARISTGLPGHPKTKKLAKRIGAAGCWHLVCLFLWTAANRSDGSLAGMTDEDVELAADWSGDDGAFVAALKTVGFLDGTHGAYAIHDWADHNPWAAGAETRSAKARWNAIKRHHGESEANRLVPEWAAIRDVESNSLDAASNAADAASTHPAMLTSNAPSPSPSPSPIPSPIPGEHLPGAEAPSCPQDERAGQTFAIVENAPPAYPQIAIPLKDGGEHVVTMAQIREWQQVYADKDVLVELKQLREWNLSNPGKRKTKSGIRKHITGWLAKPANANAPPGRRNNTDSYFEGVSEKFENYNGPTVSLL